MGPHILNPKAIMVKIRSYREPLPDTSMNRWTKALSPLAFFMYKAGNA